VVKNLKRQARDVRSLVKEIDEFIIHDSWYDFPPKPATIISMLMY
jgi:hypothetical protein